MAPDKKVRLSKKRVPEKSDLASNFPPLANFKTDRFQFVMLQSLQHLQKLITYWMQKLSSSDQNKKGTSKNDEIKKLKEHKERIKEFEFIKDLQ